MRYYKDMKPNDISDLQQIVVLLQAGGATRRDMVALLILLRESLSKTANPMLLDISHCVAHSKRDRGLAYDYIEPFLADFIEIVKKGGTLRVEVLFPIQKVIKELSSALNNVDVATANEKLLLLQVNHIRALFEEVLDGVELKLNHPNISNCKFEAGTSKHGDRFAFTTHFIGLEKAPVIQIPTKVGMAFPVFE
jgi:hypothetical protein